MSEEKPQEQPNTEAQEATTQDQTPQPDQADISKRLEELESKWKKEVAGRDRRIAELDKKVQEAELAKLDEKERAEKLLENANKEYERITAETAEKERQFAIKEKLYNAGLPQTFAKRITGQTEEEIDADIKELQSFLDSEKDKLVEKTINERLGGISPKAGESPSKKMTLEEISKIQDHSERVKRLKELGY